MLDTTREVEVPEGITLSLPVAGYVSRALAFIIDIIAGFIIIWGVAALVGVFGEFGLGLIYITAFLVKWFYPVFFEIFWHGQTPGKKVMGIKVVNDDGTPIDWSSSIIRNLLHFADMLPFLYGFGILTMLLNKDFKRLGDLAAGTLVIHQRDKVFEGADHQVDGLAPKTPLTLEEQSAIIAFSERQNRMSEARVSELAAYLAPWLDQAKMQSKTESAATQLTRMAKWLRGHG